MRPKGDRHGAGVVCVPNSPSVHLLVIYKISDNFFYFWNMRMLNEGGTEVGEEVLLAQPLKVPFSPHRPSLSHLYFSRRNSPPSKILFPPRVSGTEVLLCLCLKSVSDVGGLGTGTLTSYKLCGGEGGRYTLDETPRPRSHMGSLPFLPKSRPLWNPPSPTHHLTRPLPL